MDIDNHEIDYNMFDLVDGDQSYVQFGDLVDDDDLDVALARNGVGNIVLTESLAETIFKIQRWLEPTDYAADSSEYRKHLKSYVAGTGNWVQETETYQAWHNASGSSFLWIKAIPGAGKSVFAAMVASKLAETQPGVPVLYFFFRQIIAKNHDPRYLIRDWLSQLVPYSPPLQSKLKRDVEEQRNLDDISLDEFWSSLLSAVAFIPKVYCVVDALDEMDFAKVGFLYRLVELGQHGQDSTVKVLMTSRPLPYIEAILRTPSILQIPILQILLQQNMVDSDIAIYVDHRLRDQDRENMTEEVRQTIRESICTKGQGSFLYARLMMDNLLHYTKQMGPDSTGADLEQALQKLPVSLEEMYNRMLFDHATRANVPQRLQVMILEWVTHSVRPLRLLELAAMLDFLAPSGKIVNDTKALVRKACGPLLEILEDETVSIIHHSFTEFLIDCDRKERIRLEIGKGQFPVIDSMKTHRLLSLKCLRYIFSRLREWRLTASRTDYEIFLSWQRAIKMRHPFLDYAVSNLCVHIGKLKSSDQSILLLLDRFMKSNNHLFVSWLDWIWPRGDYVETPPVLRSVSPLHVAAYGGMSNYCQHLIQLGHDINSLDGQSRTPLAWASRNGHADVVAVLLECKAHADLAGADGLKPLHFASKANHFEVVRLLLAAGVNPMTGITKANEWNPTTIGETALMYACRKGCVETVVEFMKYLSASELNQALGGASEANKTNVVLALLKSPEISVNTVENEGCNTPLFYAAAARNPALIRALLKKGADPNARSRNLPVPESEYDTSEGPGPTPMHALAGIETRRHYGLKRGEAVVRECFQLLIDAGSDINAATWDGKQPIHYSVESSEHSPEDLLVVTSLLLENGADAMAESNDGSTPMHFVFSSGQYQVKTLIDLLVRHNANVNAKRHADGKTPLHVMLHGLELHSFELQNFYLQSFLAYMPDVNAQDDEGNSPLHVAVEFGRTSTIETLIHAGADPSKRNSKLEAPIHMLGTDWFYVAGTDAPISIMIDAGADLEARDNLGRTALLRGVSQGLPLVTFVDLGAKIDARDVHGNSALHMFSQSNLSYVSVEVLQARLRVLVEAGVDPKWVNHEGDTALHEAARLKSAHDFNFDGQKCYLETLLELGVPGTHKNHSGATALHIACSRKPNEYYFNEWIGIIEILLGPKCGIGINDCDNNGIRPIHLASAVSARLAGWLLEAGADPTLRTIDDQTPLQVACRARQSNIVGMLVETYQHRKESSLIDWADRRGRTALHDASGSGRPESVRLLLDAGADPNAKDENGFGPLHVCAEFAEESVLWTVWTTGKGTWEDEDTANVDAVNVLIGETRRPCPRNWHKERHPLRIHREDDTARIRQSIRLLLAHGADLLALSHSESTPFDIALSTGCEAMVDELLPAMQQVYAKNEKWPLDKWGIISHDPFTDVNRGLITQQSSGPGLEDLVNKFAESHEWSELLRLDNEVVFDELIRLQVDFLNFRTKRESLPEMLVKWGYAELLQKFGPHVSMFDDFAQIIDQKIRAETQLRPLLHEACQRELPNMDAIMKLVDELGVDVNARKFNTTAMHLLASGGHWWQMQAMTFLIQRGANIEMKNECGETPLALCVGGGRSRGRRKPGFWSVAAAEVLLKHGANPNSVDAEGLTCLNKAAPNLQLLRLLIENGADISFGDFPPLFTAIRSRDLASAIVFLEYFPDCNIRPTSTGHFQVQRVACSNKPPGYRVPDKELYPLFVAASPINNSMELQSGALPIVKLLLDNGANPYLVFDGKYTVLHDLFELGGILQPFLDLPSLDLEHRDPQGRTLLLAGCRSQSPSSFAPRFAHMMVVGQEDRTSLANLLYNKGADLMARDAQGMNALHHLLDRTDSSARGIVDFSTEYKKTFALFIKDAPALIHQKDLKGDTPLHYALRGLNLWSSQALLSASADPMEPDSDGNTGLHHLAKVCTVCEQSPDHSELFKQFVALGISINAKNKAGDTPLFLLVSSYPPGGYCLNQSHREHLTALSEAGADFMARNSSNETLLHVFARVTASTKRCCIVAVNRSCYSYRNKEFFKLLMELGCDPLAEDGNQRTALDVAAAHGNNAILKLFQREPDSAATRIETDDDEFDLWNV